METEIRNECIVAEGSISNAIDALTEICNMSASDSRRFAVADFAVRGLRTAQDLVIAMHSESIQPEIGED